MTRILAAACLLALAPGLPALELWRHPEAAEKNALYLDGKPGSLSFADGLAFMPAEFSADYLLPCFLPLSIGGYVKTPAPNLKSFGARFAWHIDTGDPASDLYFLYVFDFGFIRNNLLERYNDEPQPLRRFDFRAGIRRRFGKRFCLVIETDYHLSGFNFGISIKLN
ncbi:MAG: hypothetical protein LBP27_00740 [Treponema sp.]|nr:hypothetical protein [Treponema sp.]